MKTNVAQKIAIAYMFALLVFWFVIYLSHSTGGTLNYAYSLAMSILPLLGGVIAMRKSKDWTGLKGFVGKGIFFLGLGIFLWGAGGIIWAYYNFFAGISAPYPSLADLGYAPSVFFYAVGAVYLARAAGADFGLKSRFAKVFIAIAPVAMFALSYYFLVFVARQGVLFSSGDPILKSILDIAYPLGDFISLTMAVVISGLSFKFLKGEYKVAIGSILLGLGVVFFADLMFSYTTTRGTYFNGDFGDLLFALAMFLLTFGVLGFSGFKKDSDEQNLHFFKFLWYS